MSKFDVKIEDYKDDKSVIILNLSGFLDTEGAYSLESIIAPLIERGTDKLLCMMDEVDFIASTGMGVLLSNSKNIREFGGDLVLTGLNENVLDIFKSLDILDFFSIYTTKSEGLEYLTNIELGPPEVKRDKRLMDLIGEILTGELNKPELNALQVAIQFSQIPDDEQLTMKDEPVSSEDISNIAISHMRFLHKIYKYIPHAYKANLPVKEILNELYNYMDISDIFFYLLHSGKGISIGDGEISDFDFSSNPELIEFLRKEKNVMNIYEIQKFSGKEHLSLAVMGCEIIIPIIVGETTIGFIFLGSKELGAEYSSFDITLFEVLSKFISNIIQIYKLCSKIKKKQ